MRTTPAIIGSALIALSIAACTTIIVPQATGGSRADGTVTMSYDFGAFEAPDVQWAPAQIEAVNRCEAWGYTDAEAFGGALNTCLLRDGFGGCNRTRVDMTYQCTSAEIP